MNTELDKDITSNTRIAVYEGEVYDLNGHTVTFGKLGGFSIWGGTVKNGKIVGDGLAAKGGTVAVKFYRSGTASDLTIENCDICFAMDNPKYLPGSGRDKKSVRIINCHSPMVASYFAFLKGSFGLIDRCSCGGSAFEHCLRGSDHHDWQVNNSTWTRVNRPGEPEKTAWDIQAGSNFSATNNTVHGYCSLGPLVGGDGKASDRLTGVRIRGLKWKGLGKLDRINIIAGTKDVQLDVTGGGNYYALKFQGGSGAYAANAIENVTVTGRLTFGAGRSLYTTDGTKLKNITLFGKRIAL